MFTNEDLVKYDSMEYWVPSKDIVKTYPDYPVHAVRGLCRRYMDDVNFKKCLRLLGSTRYVNKGLFGIFIKSLPNVKPIGIISNERNDIIDGLLKHIGKGDVIRGMIETMIDTNDFNLSCEILRKLKDNVLNGSSPTYVVQSIKPAKELYYPDQVRNPEKIKIWEKVDKLYVGDSIIFTIKSNSDLHRIKDVLLQMKRATGKVLSRRVLGVSCKVTRIA